MCAWHGRESKSEEGFPRNGRVQPAPGVDWGCERASLRGEHGCVGRRALAEAVTEVGTRDFRFEDDGIADEIVEVRRVSSCFTAIPAVKKKGKQLVLDAERTRDRIRANEFIDEVRPTGSGCGRGWPRGCQRDYQRLAPRASRVFCPNRGVESEGVFHTVLRGALLSGGQWSFA